jgi:glycosyltransferase involved in cell wall biosynthesis
LALVSAITCVYNGAPTIAKAIDSILAQAIDGMDIIVVDDGSTDSTRTVLERYGSRIKLLVQPNAGVSAACNAAVRVSSSEYLAFLDADDVWLPGRVAKTVAALQRNRQAQLAFTDYLIGPDLGAALDVIAFDGSPSLDDMLRLWMPIARSAVTMRRETFERCGGFPEGVRWGEDMCLWLRTREQGTFQHINEPLAIYRRMTFPSSEQRYSLAARKRFERVVLTRFGNRAKPLIREARAQFASVLLNSALRQIEAGDRRGALRSWSVLMRCNPLYLVRHGNLRRLGSRKNLLRLFAMLAPATFSQRRPGDGGQL